MSVELAISGDRPIGGNAGPRNAMVLAICQALFTAALSIDLTLTGLTGYQLAPDKSPATLPFAMITVAGAVVTLFASLLMQRIGRRVGFTIGAVVGGLGGLVSVWSVFHSRFWIFCIGTAAVGVFSAFAQYYRLAAAGSVPEEARSKAISTVLTGGMIAVVLGPALAAWIKDLFPVLFAGSYLMVCFLGLASALLLGIGYRDIAPAHLDSAVSSLPARPLGIVLRQPVFIATAANLARLQRKASRMRRASRAGSRARAGSSGLR